MEQDTAYRILDTALGALTWAREWRERAQNEGPTEGAAGERYDWYRQGSEAAARHDFACVEEELRKLLLLPAAEDDPRPAPRIAD
jgi:hypothetical protein